MGKTEEALLNTIKESDSIFPDKKQIESFEKAIDEFNSLILQGYTRSRGYTLQTIEEFYTVGTLENQKN